VRTTEVVTTDGRASIVWIDGECIGYTCQCGQEELVLGIYSDDPAECDTCGKKLYCEISVKVFEVEALH
jgi:hypothetical protein